MMPPNNLHPKHPSSSKESETQPAAAAAANNNNNNRKPNSSSRPQDQAMKCPRCDSPNTKFCYYNNYSLTQPRHFCKTCRRYWTKGGALRNVPIGGGCRKNKKMMKSSSSSTSSARTDSSGSSDMGASCSATGFKFFPSGLSPAMDFNLGGLSFPRLNLNPSPPTPLYNNNHPFPNSFADISASCGPAAMTNPPPCFSLDPSATATGSLLGFNYNPLPTVAAAGLGGAIQDMGGAAASASAGGGNGLNINTNLASSIESLSCMNQDLHWKLQQQRLAMLFGSENNSSSNNNNNNNQKEENHGSSQINKPQPILFQNLEISKQGEVCSRKESGETATEWFFGNSYGGGGGVNNNANSTNSSSNGNDQSNNSTGYHHHHHHHAVQQQQQQAGGWGDLHQYNALP